MKRNSILTVIILGLCLFLNTNIQAKHVTSAAPVYLTFQAENGSILKQLINEDGTITCIFNPSDVIRINTIMLNGSDVTYKLEGYKYTTPLLTENSTLEICFDSTTTDNFPMKYNTITSSFAEHSAILKTGINSKDYISVNTESGTLLKSAKVTNGEL